MFFDKKVCIITGGSAGHVFPAIALSKMLKADLFVEEKCKKLVYHFSGTFHFNKTINPFYNVFKVSQLIYYLFHYDTIICFGSYVTIPAILSSRVLFQNLFLHEQNSILGLANKFGYWLGGKILFSFNNNHNYHCSEVFGFPIIKKHIASEKNHIVVLNGSTINGSELFDYKISYLIRDYAKQNNLFVYHQSSNVSDVLNIYNHHNIEVQPFFPEYESLIASARLVICRAGASSIATSLLYKKPTILIPLSNSKDNHQVANAKESGFHYLLESNINDLPQLLNKDLKPYHSNLQLLII